MAATPEDLAHPEFLVETEWLAARLGQSDLHALDSTAHIAFNPVTMFPPITPPSRLSVRACCVRRRHSAWAKSYRSSRPHPVAD
jgi:hypothetical protein